MVIHIVCPVCRFKNEAGVTDLVRDTDITCQNCGALLDAIEEKLIYKELVA